MAEEIEKQAGTAEQRHPAEAPGTDESEAERPPRLREIFRQALDKARREQQPAANQRQKSRDRSKSLFLVVGAAIAVVLLFLIVFSSPNTTKNRASSKRPGTPDLGRPETPGQPATSQMGSVTPLMSAQTSREDLARSQTVTPDDVNKTARPVQPAPVPVRRPEANAPPTNPERYAIGRIEFPTAEGDQRGESASPKHNAVSTASKESDGLRAPALVFVRSAQTSPIGAAPQPALERPQESIRTLNLPVGTRMIARLQSAVSSAVRTPVVAAIEYNYERDGEIVVPAGTKAVGSLQQVNRSGYVAIHFDTLEMPDGTTEKIDATAMSLTYGALKGSVGGRRTGTRFLVRALTGLGTVATYLVAPNAGNGFNGPLSETDLLRERIATNVGIAGDQELTNLTFNENIVVTVPANTRFYLVLQKASSAGQSGSRPAASSNRTVVNTGIPSVEELRELMQLRRELNEMYQTPGQVPAAQEPQQ